MLRSIRNVKLLKCVSLICLSPLFVFYSSLNNNQRKLICVSRTIHDLSVYTCQYFSTNRANQALRLLANAGFQNRGVCPQAFPSFPSPFPPLTFFGSRFISRSVKTDNPFLGLSLLRNLTETLARQATPVLVLAYIKQSEAPRKFFKILPFYLKKPAAWRGGNLC